MEAHILILPPLSGEVIRMDLAREAGWRPWPAVAVASKTGRENMARETPDEFWERMRSSHSSGGGASDPVGGAIPEPTRPEPPPAPPPRPQEWDRPPADEDR